MKRIRNTTKDKAVYFLFATCILFSLIFSAGCGNKFFDPRQVGRFRPVPAVNVILDSLGVAEEEPSLWEAAEEPRLDDVVARDGDYVFSSGDTVMVSIFELLQSGVLFVNQYVITETGRMSTIPEVGAVQARGLTESQLEEEIKRILEPSILKDPQVTVTLVGSQQRTFSISGTGVPVPGRYAIPRYDFRLLEAIATAGGISQFNIDNVYVTRSVQDEGVPAERIGMPGLGELELIEPGITEPENIEPENLIEPEREMLEIIAPRVQKNRYKWPESKVVVTSSEMATDKEYEIVVTPESSGRIDNRRRGWDGVRTVPKLSAGPVDSDTVDEPLKDEPVSVKDILRTLAEKSRQDNAVELQVGVQDSMKTPMATDLPGEENTENEINVDEILRTLSERSAQDRADDRIAPERVDEQIDVDDILKSFDEPERPGEVEEPIGVEELLRSLDQSESAPPAETKEEQIDIEEMLKTLGRPDKPGMIDEQIGMEDVVDILDSTGKPVEIELGMVQDEEEAGRIEWIFQDGKWIPVQVGKPKVQEPVIEIETEQQPIVPSPGPFVKKLVMELEGAPGTRTRVIKIPARKLSSGDPRYNIVIKQGDDIQVPVNVIGEFCIMGNVNQQGYINMTGRPMTLKMAIAAAGGLGPLAWPKRCEVVRRIGNKKEEIVRVDLDKIASGEQPDFFIKPNDLINVGTHYSAQWRAVLRNAFRATYGFGFLYDRNFAYDDYYSSRRIDLKEAIKLF